MSLKNRPFIGTWQMSSQTVVRHTPDCIVMINGYSEFATCTTCAKPLDLQKYITTVSVDATVDPISSANFTLQVPRHETGVFSYDGTYVLQPNLEVVIIMRGYFPMKGYAGKGQNKENSGLGQSENFDANEVPVHPYYQVFRGVVTEVSHEFSGGFYSASVQCSNLLHFWQNLHLSVNGAVFGKRPVKSLVEPHLIGHKFTNTNPYSIIYTLVKVGFGAAYGVDFQFSKQTNVRASDDDNRQSLFAHAAEWWAKRWTEHSGNLRMYGINGQIFNAFEQAYLGRWFDTRTNGKTSQNAFFNTAKRLFDGVSGGNDFNINSAQSIMKNARELGWDPLATNASIVASQKRNRDGSVRAGSDVKFVTEDILRMHAFSLDIGKMGSVNMFETEYMSKMEIAESVKTITGYEFYQDVDGDLVFKPPMYNMDTRDDPVYRIADRDLISISESESEPEATLMKGTGSQFSNITGHGVDGWMGVGGVFIDYRLVAKYGYREETFETNYMNNRQAIFMSAMNRLDLANAGVKSASITIPLRPELRPGYPVYIEHLDCFYYAKSLSHSFAFGGSCTTTINGIAKRVKFLPPMEPGGDGKFPSIDQVRLDAPGQYPAQPLYGYPDRIAAGVDGLDVDANVGNSGPPRIFGFPNVIMALDADQINLDTVDLNRGILTAEAYVQIALSSGFLETVPGKDDEFFLRSSNTGGQSIPLADIQQEWTDASRALAAGEELPNPDSTLGQIIQSIDQRLGGVDTPDVKNLISFLSLQTSLKSMFSPGTTIAGKYRYFSSSHPHPNHQAPKNLYVDQESGGILRTTEGEPDEGFTRLVPTFRDVGDGKGIKISNEKVTRSVRIASFSDKEVKKDDRQGIVPAIKTQNVSTADIRFVTFGPQITRKQYQVSEVQSGWGNGLNFVLNGRETTAAFASLLAFRAIGDPSLPVAERFEEEYDRILTTITVFAAALGIAADSEVTQELNKVATVTLGLAWASSYDASLPATSSKDESGQRIQGIFSTGDQAKDFIAIKKLALELAQALYLYVSIVTTVARREKTFEDQSTEGGETFDQFMVFRADWITSYTEGEARPNDASPGKTFFFRPDYQPTPDWTPIFPVSDSGGYEVYGNLPYGRGVTIELYSNLIQSTLSGESTDSAADDSATSVTTVGDTSGSNAASMDQIEKFYALALVIKFGSLKPAVEAALLAANNTTRADVTATIEALQKDDRSEGAKVRNSPITSFFRGQAIFGDTAARNLANLDVDGVICACKGVEANFLLQAFSEQYVDRYTDPATGDGDPVQGFLEETTFVSAESWRATQQAMAGQTLDIRNTTLAEEFLRQGEFATDNFNDLVEGLRNATSPDEG